EGGGFIASGLIGSRDFVVESGARLFVDALGIEGFLVPADRGLGDALVEEALCQPGIGLHDLRERMSAVDGLAGLLQLANGFIEQAHFAESDAEVVMGLGILV